jgi:flagellar protein FliS
MTASPERRLLMLFARLKIDLQSAAEAFVELDHKRINDSLVHAQQILFALRDPLDTAYELGRNLRSLYTFCVDRLVAANIHKDSSLLPAVSDIVCGLAEANEQAVVAMEQGQHALA